MPPHSILHHDSIGLDPPAQRWSCLFDTIPWSIVRHRHALSPREAEVSRALLERASVSRVAFVLGIAEGTVKTHMRRIYRKLGIGSRYELLLCVLDAGRGVVDESA